jgi:protoheme IX farnesyltransferase
MTAAALSADRPGWPALFLELTKFKISAASTFTAATGYIAFRRGADLGLLTALLGTLLLAMASSTFNEVQERKLDALMARTRHRPIPSGAVSAVNASLLAALLGICGLLALFLFHGGLTAALGLLAMVWYNGFYTPLKRVTAFAVVPGSVIGALPPAIGWVAAGGFIGDPGLLALCFVFFVWQVPHFWLLAMLHQEGYADAGFPTLAQHFQPAQILRLTFTWTCGTVSACALLPLFGTTRGSVALALLALGSLWLVFKFQRLLRPGMDSVEIRRAFMQINVFSLLVMAAVILDAFGLT